MAHGPRKKSKQDLEKSELMLKELKLRFLKFVRASSALRLRISANFFLFRAHLASRSQGLPSFLVKCEVSPRWEPNIRLHLSHFLQEKDIKSKLIILKDSHQKIVNEITKIAKKTSFYKCLGLKSSKIVKMN